MTSSPRTTFIGILAGIMLFFGGILKDRASNPTAPPITFGNIGPAAAVAVLGALSKDSNK